MAHYPAFNQHKNGSMIEPKAKKKHGQTVPQPLIQSQQRIKERCKRARKSETQTNQIVEPHKEEVQAIGLLVSVSYTHYCASTSDLSNL